MNRYKIYNTNSKTQPFLKCNYSKAHDTEEAQLKLKNVVYCPQHRQDVGHKCAGESMRGASQGNSKTHTQRVILKSFKLL